MESWLNEMQYWTLPAVNVVQDTFHVQRHDGFLPSSDSRKASETSESMKPFSVKTAAQ